MSIDHEKVEQLRHKLLYHCTLAHHFAIDGIGCAPHLRNALETLKELENETSMEKIMGGPREGGSGQTA